MSFIFEIGKEYKTQAGNIIRVLGRTKLVGYEAIECSDGIYRYDRSTHSSDAGRCTGTSHDYSYEHNILRDESVRQILIDNIIKKLKDTEYETLSEIMALLV